MSAYRTGAKDQTVPSRELDWAAVLARPFVWLGMLLRFIAEVVIDFSPVIVGGAWASSGDWAGAIWVALFTFALWFLFWGIMNDFRRSRGMDLYVPVWARIVRWVYRACVAVWRAGQRPVWRGDNQEFVSLAERLRDDRRREFSDAIKQAVDRQKKIQEMVRKSQPESEL